MDTLWRTTVSTVSPGPNPNNTPHSRPSPVVLNPSVAEECLISFRINRTQALDMFPYSLSTCRVACSLSGVKASFSSTWSKIAGPPGCAIQKKWWMDITFTYMTPLSQFDGWHVTTLAYQTMYMD
ncbi:hypothetical protein CTI12_AA446090 [Artemisia annua]|uniref:Uncharacterized protein n=1 Tax=Artemisia annua TaxID=35608 RepID=A0A2U1LWE6_ARTAN|nr:hypothetical protein CTI12_AA446090 [Artemisia annua]